MAEILTLVQDHDEQAVLSAVELALNRVHRASKICITAPKRAGNARRAVLRMLWSLKPCEGTDSPQTLVKRLDRNGEPAGSGFFRSLNDLVRPLGVATNTADVAEENCARLRRRYSSCKRVGSLRAGAIHTGPASEIFCKAPVALLIEEPRAMSRHEP